MILNEGVPDYRVYQCNSNSQITLLKKDEAVTVGTWRAAAAAVYNV